MDSYLKIAEKILFSSKTPLTAKEILEAAYKNQMVPTHLFGKTQHKTLQARLSEDVLYNKARTIFTRTGPGRFALRADRPSDQNTRYVAPLRSYQLKKFEVLCAETEDLNQRFANRNNLCSFSSIAELFSHKMSLIKAERDATYLPLQILVTIHHDDMILCVGGSFETDQKSEKTLGFFGYLKETDADLFSADALGIDNAARRIIYEHTQIPIQEIERLVQLRDYSSIMFLRLTETHAPQGVAIVITAYECLDPDVIINSVAMDHVARWSKATTGINDVNALDEISRAIASDSNLTHLLSGARLR